MILAQVAAANWPRFESAHSGVDVLSLSFRQALNMLLAFVMTNVNEDDWTKKWRPEFQYDPATQKRMNRRLSGIKPASGDKRATISFPKGRAKPYNAGASDGQGDAAGGG